MALFFVTLSVPEDSDSVNYCPYVSGGQVRKMVDTITGLTHLNGETVEIQMDGVVPDTNSFVVASGSITLPEKAAVIHAGLPYDNEIRLLKASQGSQLGTGQGKKRRIFLSAMDLYRSLGLKIGLDDDHLDKIFQGQPALPLFTGEQEKLPDTIWDEEAELIIKQDKPLPAHIVSIITRSEVEEGV